MQLYLIRHAEAEVLGSGGVTRDFDRPLTARGRADSRALAEAFLRQQIAIDAVVASPLVRAHQTATEFISILAPDIRVVTCDELALFRLRPGKLTDFLVEVPTSGARVADRADKAVAAIGHMPDLGAYLEWLLGAAVGSVRMAKASAARVSFKVAPARGTGRLEWLVTPNWFNHLPV